MKGKLCKWTEEKHEITTVVPAALLKKVQAHRATSGETGQALVQRLLEKELTKAEGQVVSEIAPVVATNKKPVETKVLQARLPNSMLKKVRLHTLMTGESRQALIIRLVEQELGEC